MTYHCYIAGPYTLGDPEKNTYMALDAADEVIDGLWPVVAPVVPHLSHWWGQHRRRSYDFWIEYTLELAKRCDVMLRLPGASKGADAEVAYFSEQGMPVVHTIDALTQWVKTRLLWTKAWELGKWAADVVSQPVDALSAENQCATSNGCGSNASQNGQSSIVNSTHEPVPLSG